MSDFFSKFTPEFTPEYLRQLKSNNGYYTPEEQLKIDIKQAEKEAYLNQFNTEMFKKLFNDFKNSVLLNPNLQKSALRGHDRLYHFAYILICKTRNTFFIGRENSIHAFNPNNKLNKLKCMSSQIQEDHKTFGTDDFQFELISYFSSEETLTEWINATLNDDFREKFIKTKMAYNTMLQFAVKKDKKTMFDSDVTTTKTEEKSNHLLSGFVFSLIGDDLLMKNNNKWEYVSEGFKSIILSHPDFKSIKRYDLVEFVNLIADKK
jgi:hypothetical protein